MHSDIKIAFVRMAQLKFMLWTAIGATCISFVAYTSHGILAYALAFPFLFLVFESSQCLLEVKEGLPRRPLWARYEVLDRLNARIIQTLIATMFWGAFMFLFGWPKDFKALMVAIVIFGAILFLIGEWQARSQKPA